MATMIPLRIGQQGELVSPEPIRAVLLGLPRRDVQAELLPDGSLKITIDPGLLAVATTVFAEEGFADADDAAQLTADIRESRREILRERQGTG